jgi:hypothetical protein
VIQDDRPLLLEFILKNANFTRNLEEVGFQLIAQQKPLSFEVLLNTVNLPIVEFKKIIETTMQNPESQNWINIIERTKSNLYHHSYITKNSHEQCSTELRILLKRCSLGYEASRQDPTDVCLRNLQLLLRTIEEEKRLRTVKWYHADYKKKLFSMVYDFLQNREYINSLVNQEHSFLFIHYIKKEIFMANIALMLISRSLVDGRLNEIKEKFANDPIIELEQLLNNIIQLIKDPFDVDGAIDEVEDFLDTCLENEHIDQKEVQRIKLLIEKMILFLEKYDELGEFNHVVHSIINDLTEDDDSFANKLKLVANKMKTSLLFLPMLNLCKTIKRLDEKIKEDSIIYDISYIQKTCKSAQQNACSSPSSVTETDKETLAEVIDYITMTRPKDPIIVSRSSVPATVRNKKSQSF